MVTLPGIAAMQDSAATEPEADPLPSASYRAALAPGAAATNDGTDAAGDGGDAAGGSGPQVSIDPLEAQRKLAGAAAEAEFLAKKTAFDEAATGDPDPGTLGLRYGAGLKAAANAVSADLAPGDRGTFQSAIAPAVAAGQARIGALADGLTQQRDRDWLGAYADGLASQYARAADEPTRQALLDAGKVAIRAMVQRGALDPEAAQVQWRGLVVGATTTRAHLMLQSDPAAFKRIAGNDDGDDGPDSGGAGFAPTGTWVDALPTDERTRLLGQATSAIVQEDKAGAIDRQRQAAAQQHALTQRARQASNGILGQILADPTSVDPFAIAKHLDLTSTQKAGLSDLLAAELDRQGRGAAKTYGSAFWPLYQRIHAPDGDPGQLTDPDAFIAAAGPGKDLTASGADRLRQELELKATPEGEAEATMKQRFLDAARGQISASASALGIADPPGDALFLKYLATALPAYDAGRAAGKTPDQLLDPDSADSIASSIPAFQRPAAEHQNVLDGLQPGGESEDAQDADSSPANFVADRQARVGAAGTGTEAVSAGASVPQQSEQPSPHASPRPLSARDKAYLDKYYDSVVALAKKYAVDPSLVLGIAGNESGFASDGTYLRTGDAFGMTGGSTDHMTTASSPAENVKQLFDRYGAQIYGTGNNVGAFINAMQGQDAAGAAVPGWKVFNRVDLNWRTKIRTDINQIQRELPLYLQQRKPPQ
jgi:hypothetical protein